MASSKDIWAMLSAVEAASKVLTPRREEDTGRSEEKDTFTLLVGEKGSGKTSVTANFRNSSKCTWSLPSLSVGCCSV